MFNSTILGSIINKRTSSGVAWVRMLAMMALIATLFPAPVAPAINMCGIRAKSPTRTAPPTSLPSAMVSLDFAFAAWYSLLSSTSLKVTSRLFLLGISTPTYGRPGTGASMRIVLASSTSARSFCKAIIRLTRARCS